MKIFIKRAYEPSAPEDGERFLVDRVWPRGVKKESLALTAWLKDVAPSNELRKWFNHRSDRWETFREKYREELKANPEALRPLYKAIASGPVTLVYSARDEERNQAVVLREHLLKTGKSAK